MIGVANPGGREKADEKCGDVTERRKHDDRQDKMLKEIARTWWKRSRREKKRQGERADTTMEESGVEPLEKRTSGCDGPEVVAKRTKRQNWRLIRHYVRETTRGKKKQVKWSEDQQVSGSLFTAKGQPKLTARRMVARGNWRPSSGEWR